jgi:hypothetical protein
MAGAILMLPGGTDGLYRAALAGPHKPTTRVEVWAQGVRLDSYGDAGLPFFSGAISATLNSQVTRQLELSTDESLWPVEPEDLLAPYGNELRVFQGVRAGSAVPYEWQTFRGRINSVTLDDDGTLTLDAIDRAGDVNDAGFILPENSETANSLVAEFRRIVLEGVPDAEFGVFDDVSGRTPAMSWEWDRATACDDLAAAGSAFWYTLANGDFVMRFIPWTVDQTPLLTLSDGPGGALTSAVPTRSRENVFNGITAVGERADGTAPVYATRFDNDGGSPTFVGGKFGLKSKLLQAPAAQTQDQAMSMAAAALQQAKSLTVSWNVGMAADPSLELGDTVTISARNLPPDVQVVSSYTLPLTAGNMTVSLRALQPGLVI